MKELYIGLTMIVLSFSTANDQVVQTRETKLIEGKIESVIDLFNDRTLDVVRSRKAKKIDTSYDSEYHEKMISSIKLSFRSWKNYRDYSCISSYYKDQMTSSYDETVNECILDKTKNYYEMLNKDLTEKLLDWEM